MVGALRFAVARLLGAQDLLVPFLSEVRDWKDFERLVGLQRVGPLISSLARRHPDIFPQETAAALAVRSRLSTLRSLAQAAHTCELTTLLGSAGVTTIVLKGAALEMSAYGEIGLRDPGDLDLLVLPEALDTAIAVMVDSGYEIDHGNVVDAPWCAAYRDIVEDLQRGGRRRRDRGDGQLQGRWRSFRKLANAISLVRADTGAVDLHWRLFRNERLFDADVWSRRAEVLVAGAAVGALSPELELVYLACHGAKHSWKAFKWLVDLPLVAKTAAQSFESVRAIAEEAGVAHVLGSALRLSTGLLGAPNREAIEAAFPPDRSSDSLVRRATEALARAADPRVAEPSGISELRLHLRMHSGVRYWARSVEETLALPNWWLDLAQPLALRPVRVVRSMITRGGV